MKPNHTCARGGYLEKDSWRREEHGCFEGKRLLSMNKTTTSQYSLIIYKLTMHLTLWEVRGYYLPEVGKLLYDSEKSNAPHIPGLISSPSLTLISALILVLT